MKKRILTALLVLVVLAGALFAVNAADDGVTTLDAYQSTLTASNGQVIDLAGFDIGTLTVPEGVTVTIKDSATADYKAATEADYGQIGTITGEGAVNAAVGYLRIDEENKGTSFHAYLLNVKNPVLRGADHMAEKGAAVYYVTELAGDEVIKANMDTFGVAMKVAGGSYRADGINGGKTYTEYPASEWKTGGVELWNSCELRGIMKAANTLKTNKRNFTINVSCAAYICLKGVEEPVYGGDYTFNLYNAVKSLDDAWVNATLDKPESIGLDAKNALVKMQELFGVFTESEYATGLRKLNQLFGADETFVIRSASDLQVVTANPDGNFQLSLFDGVTDLDMKGLDWTPFTNFTGTFANPQNKTISNLTINGAGFFETVDQDATVTDLHLRNVTVDASKAKATAVGTIAGTNNGTITGVTATGTVTSTRDNAKVGALVGKSTTAITPGATITDTISVKQLKKGVGSYGISDTATTYTTGNLSAIVGLYTEGKNVTKGLVAEGDVTNAASVYWRDTSYSTERQSESLQAKREKVVQEMYNSGTYRWTPAVTFTHYAKSTTHTKTFNAGWTYVGTPYDHRSTPYAMAMDFAKIDSKDSSRYLMDVSEYVTDWTNNYDKADMEKTSPYDGYTRFISSDCSSACIVAWHQVSPILLNSKTNGGVSPDWTSSLVASQVNQWYYGVRPVGYTVDAAETYDVDKKLDDDGNEVLYNEAYVGGMAEYYGEFRNTPVYVMTTDAIAQKLGAEGVYEAYAQTRMGDVLNCSGTGGHSRMAAQDPVVIRNGENDIDPDKSFFLTHEQGDGLYDFGTQGNNFEDGTRSSWRINYKYTFKELSWVGLTAEQQTAIKNSHNVTYGYYLPVTMDALNKAVSHIAVAPGASYAYSPEDTKINSEVRLLSAKLIIREYDESTGEAGEEVYTKTFYKSGINEAYGCTSTVSNYRNAPGAAPIYSWHFIAKEDYADALTEGQTYIYDYAVRTLMDPNTETYLSTVLKQGAKDSYNETTNYIFTYSAS